MPSAPLFESQLPGLTCRRGKVRDVYDLGDRLVLVATDRVSAFDVIMPTAIPDKGRILTALTLFWLDFLGVPHHLLETDPRRMGEPFASHADVLAGRTCMVRKTQVIPFECVARGYLVGSGWKEYRAHGTVCGQSLPTGLEQAAKLPTTLFTPATKAEVGHDENVPFERMVDDLGEELAVLARKRTLAIYEKAATHAASCGLILADTKLEWGLTTAGEMILIDEVLTPDSSRFWPADQWRVGISPPSFDKQYLRDWLEANWDPQTPAPILPDEIVEQTRRRYHEAYERLTGKKLEG